MTDVGVLKNKVLIHWFMWNTWIAPDGLDPLILPAVQILNEHGFHTFESCQGGEGHCFPEPTVRFEGNEFDIIRACEICMNYGLNVMDGRRVYRKVLEYKGDKNGNDTIPIGLVWDKPFNEITFVTHSKTGTIFLPD